MGAETGDFSSPIFDEEKRYVGAKQQQKKPAVDSLFNQFFQQREAVFRRFIQNIFGSGVSGGSDAFQIIESSISNINNFTVKGGGGTAENAARFYNNGHSCLLFADIEYNNSGATEGQKSIHAQSTALSDTVLTDSAANYTVDELAGRELNPDITQGTTFTILSNTATTVTVASGLSGVAVVGDRYRVDLSTPGGVRDDVVYVDSYLDEINKSDDPSIEITVDGSPIESKLPFQTIQTIKVRENSTTIPTSPFTDLDGNVHYYSELAELNRDANNTVLTAEIADSRTDLVAFVVDLESGTRVPFQQAAAPTGWTKDVSAGIENRGLRMTGSGAFTGGGGSVGFTTAMATPSVAGSVGATTLTIAQSPAHVHELRGQFSGVGGSDPQLDGPATDDAVNTQSTGGDGSHTHSLSSATATINLQYIDLIIATKD